MAGKSSRLGMLDAKGSNRPLNVFPTDSVRRAWTARMELPQICVGAAGNHEFKPGMVKRAVNGCPNEVDRDRTPVPFARNLCYLLRHLVEDQFTQMLDGLGERILPGRKVVERASRDNPARSAISEPVVLAYPRSIKQKSAASSRRRRVSALFSSCFRYGLRVCRPMPSIVGPHASKGPGAESICPLVQRAHQFSLQKHNKGGLCF